MKDIISFTVAYVLIFCFWLFFGVILAPFWLFLLVVGALLQAIEWKEIPVRLWDMVMIKWFF